MGIAQLALLALVGGGVWFFYSNSRQKHPQKQASESSYTRRTEGSYAVFAVQPAGHTTYGFMRNVGVAGAVIAILAATTRNPSFVAALTAGLFAVVGFWGGYRRELRPASHLISRQFRVSPGGIESDGRVFKRDDIHQVTIHNGIHTGDQATVTLASDDIAGGLQANANYRATVTGTCYSLEVETGGKSYLLAGGMDATTVRGLRIDVTRALG